MTIWRNLLDLGYEWIIRFDDDSLLLSPVTYNLFDFMRESKKVYGFRSYSFECGNIKFGPFVDDYASQHGIDMVQKVGSVNYCSGHGQNGFYNNFYICRIDFWLSADVWEFIQAFDRSRLIFIERDNDLIFQTAAVRLFANMSEVHHFYDFTYLHHTNSHGTIIFGGLDVGLNDKYGIQHVQKYVNLYRKSPDEVHLCTFDDTRCGVLGGPTGISSVLIRATNTPACCGDAVVYANFLHFKPDQNVDQAFERSSALMPEAD